MVYAEAMTIFFCGIGGSGMFPLAFLLKSTGAAIAASDRSFDQGKTPDKFAFLQQQGIRLFPQDGSGITDDVTALIISNAVEDTIPEVVAAKARNIPIRKRAELLAELVNKASRRVVVAGTSGKTTTTGMIAFLAQETGLEPAVMNGGIFNNYTAQHPYCSWLAGTSGLFITEADESDGSIALYQPDLAILNNVSLDHKSMEELRQLFGDYLKRAKHAVLNFDSAEVRELTATAQVPFTSYSLAGQAATLQASNIIPGRAGIQATITNTATGEVAQLHLGVPGQHNVANAMAALSTALWLGIPLAIACEVLGRFKGIKRRMDVVGTANDITVIDDFGHNPDKIAATLSTLRAFPGRLLVMFQPHGFGPLRLMRGELVEAFKQLLDTNDKVYLPEPYYAGGTVDRSVGSRHIVEDLQKQGVQAEVFATRADTAPAILRDAKAGDRIVIMGARDDTLSDFAHMLLRELA